MRDIEKEIYEDRGNLSGNCGQIFSKEPKFVSKVRKNEYISRHIWVGLLILFVPSFCAILVWFTNDSDSIALQNLILKNGTNAYTNFIQPKVYPYVGVHIFNYTNVENFEKGIDSKLHVEDVGPYVYQEILERNNPRFEEDGSLSYQEKRSYKFIPEMSGHLRESDQIVVPNLPLLVSVDIVKDAHFITKLSLRTVIKSLDLKPFLKLAANKFILGYDDQFFTLMKRMVAFEQEMSFIKFGILGFKNGTSKDRIAVNTGSNDLNLIGNVMKYNGSEKMQHWNTDECNRIDGSVGAFFSPYTIRRKEPVNIYAKELCRRLPLNFDKEVEIMDIKSFKNYTAYRYIADEHAFAHPDYLPSNQCFCDLETGVCPPHGIVNATPCSYGPTYFSYPHFMHGDPKLTEAVSGLSPDEDIHTSYLDIHPSFGYTMQGVIRMQLNMLARKVNGIPQVDMFEDKTMLPVAWFDSGVVAQQLSESIDDIVYMTSSTTTIENCFEYGCILITIAIFITMVMMIHGRPRSK